MQREVNKMQCEVNKMEHEVNNFQKIFLLLKSRENEFKWLRGREQKGYITSCYIPHYVT